MSEKFVRLNWLESFCERVYRITSAKNVVKFRRRLSATVDRFAWIVQFDFEYKGGLADPVRVEIISFLRHVKLYNDPRMESFSRIKAEPLSLVALAEYSRFEPIPKLKRRSLRTYVAVKPRVWIGLPLCT